MNNKVEHFCEISCLDFLFLVACEIFIWIFFLESGGDGLDRVVVGDPTPVPPRAHEGGSDRLPALDIQAGETTANR